MFNLLNDLSAYFVFFTSKSLHCYDNKTFIFYLCDSNN